MNGAAGFHGPKSWAASAVCGMAAGAALGWVAPQGDSVALWTVAPFALLLAAIALMPFIHAGFWHRRYPEVALAMGGLVAGYYTTGMVHGGGHLLHTLTEYYAFIALVGGLYVVSGTILIDVRGRGTPVVNTAILFVGAVLANLVGTTGASMLLIRPFMRVNGGRLRPLHVVFFIVIVSNCGGCLTPIGDPPLYLGYLKGVPFLWTSEYLWQDWVFTIGALLAVFFAWDSTVPRGDAGEKRGVHIHGGVGLACLVLMVAGVFIGPVLQELIDIEDWPVGATFQLVVAVVAYKAAPRDILAGNAFSFEPVKEVGLLFAGIFLTMMPALAYLAGHRLGIESPTAFYFGTGVLSAVLDNAPTYVNFVQVAFAGTPIEHETMAEFLTKPRGILIMEAISTGAVFFGAMTYIGNGPNFMVKAIAEAAGVRMPSFFGYLAWAGGILLPVLVVHWLLFIR